MSALSGVAQNVRSPPGCAIPKLTDILYDGAVKLPPWSKRSWFVAVLIAIIVATFANSLANGYVWDDFDILVDNPETHSLSNLKKVLFSADLTPPYYRPLVRASFLLEYAAFGANPVVSHGIGVAFHVAAAALLFFLARLLFRRDGPAFVAALLWGVHPVAAEAVGLVAVRTSPTAMFFMLGALLAAWRAWNGGSRVWLAVSGLGTLSAMGCKEQGVMVLPLFALLIVLSPRLDGPAATKKSVAVAFAPMVVALAAYLAARVHSLSGLFGEVPRVVGKHASMSAADMAMATGNYLFMLLWPAKLTVVHELAAHSGALMMVGFVVLAGASVFTLRYPRPARVFGMSWFWLTLLPTLQVVALPSAAVAERHAYFLGLGLALVIVDAIVNLLAFRPSKKLALAAAGAAGLVAVGLAARTIVRNRDWRDNRTLFESSLAVRPTALAHLNLGNEAIRRGDKTAAESHWLAAVQFDPRDADALNQLGVLAAQARRYDEARVYFTRAVEAFPDHPVATANLKRLPGPRRQRPPH